MIKYNILNEEILLGGSAWIESNTIQYHWQCCTLLIIKVVYIIHTIIVNYNDIHDNRLKVNKNTVVIKLQNKVSSNAYWYPIANEEGTIYPYFKMPAFQITGTGKLPQ